MITKTNEEQSFYLVEGKWRAFDVPQGELGKAYTFADMKAEQAKAVTFETLRANKLTQLKTTCDSAITEQRFTSSATGTPVQYRCRVADQLNLSGCVQGGSDHMIVTYANDAAEAVRQSHTAEQCVQVRVDMTDHIETRIAHHSDLKGQVNAIAGDTPENREKLESIAWEINNF
ncbi:hypothetical protein AB4407_08660 [Vibrio sp. 10N.261.46.E11]|uniref:DUF4376 domain-containing protein n=1 Tax=Vibrio sp. 10N.261.46.E11 TaxID=3229662 RepID=UPI003553DB9B